MNIQYFMLPGSKIPLICPWIQAACNKYPIAPVTITYKRGAKGQTYLIDFWRDGIS